MELAKQLLDWEFDAFDANPKGYIDSMGWSLENFPQIAQLKGKICPDKADYSKLDKIIKSVYRDNPDAEAEDIIMNSKVTDFCTNCVAEKISKKYKKMFL